MTERRPDIKLRRCPCCKGPAVVSHRLTERFLPAAVTREELWRVDCFDCNMMTSWSDSLEFIASQWNRRPGRATLVKR